MPLTAFPNGISSFGVPVMGAGGMVPTTTGTYYFVDSATGAAGNDGRSSATPFATVDQGISACTANKGDVVICMPGHAETVTATSIALDVAGVQVVGLGTGLKRPVFTFGAAAATVTVSAANCGWFNCHHIANFADVAAAFTLGAAKDFTLQNNTFSDAATNKDFLSIVVTGSTANAADGLHVIGNWYQGLAATANAVISVLGNLDRLIVDGNYADKLATNDAGQFITAAALVMTAVQITRNTLSVLGATGNLVGIFLTSSATTDTGVVAYNIVGSLDTTTELLSTTGTKLRFFENYYTGTADASGKLWPVVDAA